MSQMTETGEVPHFTLGDRLGKAMRHADVSAAEMADYLDVHRNTISAYINDRQPVKGGTLKLWAMRTGVPLEWLEFGVEPQRPPTPPRASGSPNEQALRELAAKKRRRARGGSTAEYVHAA